MTSHGATTGEPVRRASLADTVLVGTRVALPLLANGLIKRRPRMQAMAGRLGLDRQSVALLRRLRARYGPGPLRLRVPGRTVVLPLGGPDVARLLESASAPFTPASREKRAALAHFQPHGVLLSRGAARARRRELNEAVLETHRPVHGLAEQITTRIDEEATDLLGSTGTELTWDRFACCWWRTVRRIVLGDTARTDDTVTGLLDRLRLDANWAYLGPRRARTFAELSRRLDGYLGRAEQGSLAALLAGQREETGAGARDQMAHWLFAFDAAGMVTLRTLALLATHPEQAAAAAAELPDGAVRAARSLPYLRACVLDTVRLWPTTPVLLRDSTEDTSWGGTRLPAGSTFLVVTPFFHRDPDTLPQADRFEPESWLDGRAEAEPGLVPFSAGPARCPGENLVLLTASTMLGCLFARRRYVLESPTGLDPGRPLPATLDNFGLRFRLGAR
ncbi:cytochrome P450 [Amycolatopsis aidingensis]|uniref:cytochrome P450 n=1 Tax=Amycolatopsis aidingensis TaxID=2842453 RepID=UPI001C0E6537|nr:cytochrome P450 [Amycolatopsis aidingensis]